MNGIQTEIARLASEVGRLTQLMEQRERSSMSPNMITSFLASMGQLVDILRIHAPSGSAAADPFTTPLDRFARVHPPPAQTDDDQATRITQSTLDGLRPQMKEIKIEIARLASKVRCLTQLME